MTRIKRYPIAWMMLAVGVTAGCRIGRAYQQPKLDLPQQYRGVATADTSSISAIPYRQFFTDATLLSLLDSAVAHNYDMQLAVQKIGYAQSALAQAKWGNIPVISLQAANVGITRSSDNSLNGLSTSQFLGTSHVEDYTSYVDISWEADIWGKIHSRKEVALANYLQSQEAARAVQTQLVSDVAQAYYNLLMLDEQLGITKKSVGLYDSTIFMTQLQKDAGQTTALAVQQIEAQREEAAASIPQLEQNISIQENALRILLGALPASVERSARLADLPVADNLPVGLPAVMVSQRPDVRESELALVSANAQANVAQASLYPTLSITAQGGVDAFKASNWFSIPGSLFGLASGGIVQPLLNHRQLKTQYEQAQNLREQAVTQFRQSVLKAVGQVSDALVTIEKLKLRKDITVRRVDTLTSAVRNAQLLFTSGLANYLEVITAQSNSLQAQLDLSSVRRQQQTAVVDLYRSLGGGWK